jgi:hypothetical protein
MSMKDRREERKSDRPIPSTAASIKRTSNRIYELLSEPKVLAKFLVETVGEIFNLLDSMEEDKSPIEKEKILEIILGLLSKIISSAIKKYQ